MNAYQKSAVVLVVRIAGAYIFLMTFFELAFQAIELALPRQVPGMPAGRFITPLVYTAVRSALVLVLWLYAIPLGRFLGKGLD